MSMPLSLPLTLSHVWNCVLQELNSPVRATDFGLSIRCVSLRAVPPVIYFVL